MNRLPVYESMSHVEGFFLFDDFWGVYEWNNLETQLHKVWPEYQAKDFRLRIQSSIRISTSKRFCKYPISTMRCAVKRQKRAESFRITWVSKTRTGDWL